MGSLALPRFEEESETDGQGERRDEREQMSLGTLIGPRPSGTRPETESHSRTLRSDCIVERTVRGTRTNIFHKRHFHIA